MIKRTSLSNVLLVAGLVLLAISLAIIIYALWPAPVTQEIITLPTSLFAPP
jgi:uncharacterized membrane protein